jgi:hypothetical protein
MWLVIRGWAWTWRWIKGRWTKGNGKTLRRSNGNARTKFPERRIKFKGVNPKGKMNLNVKGQIEFKAK